MTTNRQTNKYSGKKRPRTSLLMKAGEESEYHWNERAAEEGRKLLYDAFKHLTTLNTGAILLMATFVKDFFKQPEWEHLIGASLVCFIVSVIASFISMATFAVSVLTDGYPSIKTMWVGFISSNAAVGCFNIGLIAFVTFAIKNFY